MVLICCDRGLVAEGTSQCCDSRSKPASNWPQGPPGISKSTACMSSLSMASTTILPQPSIVIMQRKKWTAYYPLQPVGRQLADFGLSRVLETHGTHVSTKTHGTLAYTAAEVLQEGRMTRASDVFAFGMMMWEVYCGKRLYEGHIATQASQPTLSICACPRCIQQSLQIPSLNASKLVVVHTSKASQAYIGAALHASLWSDDLLLGLYIAGACNFCSKAVVPIRWDRAHQKIHATRKIEGWLH